MLFLVELKTFELENNDPGHAQILALGLRKR